jgi:uncharacterized protein
MTVLIVGATGLIGKSLVKSCLSRGWRVHFLTTRKGQLNQIDGAYGFLWNIDQSFIDKACFDGVSVVVNLAGTPVSLPWRKANKRKILNSRILGARLLNDTLAALKGHQVQRYIGASGISGYPSHPSHCYQERDAADAATFLGDVVRQWEDAALSFKILGMSVAMVRTGLVLAPNGGVLSQIAQPIKMGFGAVLGQGKQWQSWIHIDDITAVYEYLMEATGQGVYNGVSPSPVQHDTMTYAIAKQCRRRIILPKAPRFALRLLLGERSALVLESQCVHPDRLMKENFNFKYTTLVSALKDLLPQ